MNQALKSKSSSSTRKSIRRQVVEKQELASPVDNNWQHEIERLKSIEFKNFEEAISAFIQSVNPSASSDEREFLGLLIDTDPELCRFLERELLG